MPLAGLYRSSCLRPYAQHNRSSICRLLQTSSASCPEMAASAAASPARTSHPYCSGPSRSNRARSSRASPGNGPNDSDAQARHVCWVPALAAPRLPAPMLPVEALCSRTRFQVHAPRSCQLIQWTDLTGVDNPIDTATVAKKQSDGLRSSTKQIQCKDAPGGIKFAASLRSAGTASHSPPIVRTSHQPSAVLRGCSQSAQEPQLRSNYPRSFSPPMYTPSWDTSPGIYPSPLEISLRAPYSPTCPSCCCCISRHFATMSPSYRRET